MSGTDSDVNIRLTAEDDASDTIQSATSRINQSYREMTNTTRAAGREWIINNEALYESGRAISHVGRVFDHAISLVNSYNLMQIRLAETARNAADAEERLAEAISQYGANSPEAQKAQKEVQKTKEAEKKAEDQSTLQTALLAGGTATQSGHIITTIPRVKQAIQAARDRVSAKQAAKNLLEAEKTTIPKSVSTGAALDAESTAMRIGGYIIRGASRAIGPAAIVQSASMLGEQQAGETSIPSGADALKDILLRDIPNAVGQQINNINISGFSPSEVITELGKRLNLINGSDGQAK